MKVKFLLLLLLLLGFTKLSFSQTTVQDRWLLKDLADREIGFVTFYYSWTWGDGGATSNVNPINIIATHSGDYLTLSNAIEEDLDESGMYWSADENLINYLAKYDSIGNMYWHLDLITNSGYDQGNNTSYRNGKPYFPNLLFENLVGNYVVVGTIRDTSSPQRPDSTCFVTVSSSGTLLSRKTLHDQYNILLDYGNGYIIGKYTNSTDYTLIKTNYNFDSLGKKNLAGSFIQKAKRINNNYFYATGTSASAEPLFLTFDSSLNLINNVAVHDTSFQFSQGKDIDFNKIDSSFFMITNGEIIHLDANGNFIKKGLAGFKNSGLTDVIVTNQNNVLVAGLDSLNQMHTSIIDTSCQPQFNSAVNHGTFYKICKNPINHQFGVLSFENYSVPISPYFFDCPPFSFNCPEVIILNDSCKINKKNIPYSFSISDTLICAGTSYTGFIRPLFGAPTVDVMDAWDDSYLTTNFGNLEFKQNYESSTDTTFTLTDILNASGVYHISISINNTYIPNLFTYRIIQQPSLNILHSPKNYLCLNDSLTILTSPYPNIISNHWSNGSTDSVIIIHNTNTSANLFNYKLSDTITDHHGCKSIDSFNVVLYNIQKPPKPTITPFADSVILCEGSSETLTSSSAYSYKWYKNGYYDEYYSHNSWHYGNQITDTIFSSGNYYVQIRQTANGCPSDFSDTLHFTFIPKLNLTKKTSAGLILCDSATSILSVKEFPNNYPNHWNTGSTDTFVVANQSYLYIDTVFDSIGCATTFSFNVIHSITPSIPHLIASPYDTVCYGNSLFISNTNSFDSTYYSWYGNGYVYQYRPNYLNVYNVNSQNYSYALAYASNHGCKSAVSDTMFFYFILPLPIQIISLGSNQYTSNYKSNFMWKCEDTNWGVIYSSSSDTISIVPNTWVLYLTASDSNGCSSSTSNYVSFVTGITNLNTPTLNDFNIVPNPCHNCQLVLNNENYALQNKFQVTDILGKTVAVQFNKTANGYEIVFPTNADGVFFIRNLETGMVKKLIRE